MFGKKVLAIAALQGVSVLAAVFAVYLWSILSGHPDDVVRSLAFATLVIGNLALILVNRSWRLSIFRAFIERHNRSLGLILGLASILLTLLLSIPALRNAFHFGPISLTEALVVVAAGFAGVIWFEVYKALGKAEQAALATDTGHTEEHGDQQSVPPRQGEFRGAHRE